VQGWALRVLVEGDITGAERNYGRVCGDGGTVGGKLTTGQQS